MRHNHRFDEERRNVLKAIAALGVTPRLLAASSLVGGVVFARATEAQTGPKKSLLLLHTGGALDNLWRPGAGLSLGPHSAPLEAVKGDVNFIAGGKMTGGGHGIMFHRYNDGSFSKDSFDVNLGRTIGANRPVKFLNLGVQTKDNNLSRQGSTGIPPIDDPETAFSRLFGGGAAPSTPGGAPSASAPNGARLAIVDLHKKAIDALKQKLGTHEKRKIEDHLTAISEFEKTVRAPAQPPGGQPPPPPPPACAKPAMPAGGRDFDATAKLQIEMAVLALKCELTASVSLAFGNDGHTFLIPGYGECHRSHHCCAGDAEYTKTVKYMMGLVAATIARVKAEGLLASTVVTQVTDMGDARSHGNENVPLLVAGAGVKKGAVTSASGKTQADLFQAVAQILGADQHPGFRAWSSSPVAGIAG